MNIGTSSICTCRSLNVYHPYFASNGGAYATFVEALARNGPLRDALTVSDAVDVVWTLTSAEVHRLLTVDRGWSGDRYEEWLADSLVALLLPETPGSLLPHDE
jgi:hypothetical protein